MPERILMSASLLLEDSTKANIEKIKQNLGKKINLKF
jgi:methylglutaconyl-CoA hydratase